MPFYPIDEVIKTLSKSTPAQRETARIALGIDVSDILDAARDLRDEPLTNSERDTHLLRLIDSISALYERIRCGQYHG